MADPKTYAIQLANWLAEGISDSSSLFNAFSTDHLGLSLPPAVVQAPDVAAALKSTASAATDVGKAGTELEAAVAGSDTEILVAIVKLGVALIQFFSALAQLVTAVRNNVTPANIPDPTALAAAQQFVNELAEVLTESILAATITDEAPQIAFIMRLLGLLDWRLAPADPGNPLSTEHVLRRLALYRLKDLFSNPEQHFKDSLGWGDPTFDPSDLFALYASFWDDETNITVGTAAGEPFLQQGHFRITRDSTTSPPSLVLSIEAALDEKLTTRSNIDDSWGANVTAEMTMTGAVSGRVTPPFSLSLLPATGSITGDVRVFVDRNQSAQPFDLLAGTGGLLSISANNLSAGVGLTAEADLAGGFKINPLVFADLSAVTIKIGTSDADSFIGQLLSGAQIQGQFDLGLEWQADTGLRIKASGGIEIALPVHIQLGPIEFDVVYIALRIKDDGTLSLEVSTALSGTLGPLSVALDRLGAQLDLRLAKGTDAKFGPFDLNLGFKPPSGAGLSINAGVVVGGGFLSFDPDKGEYAGVAELSIADVVTVKAIGLITTKMPDGSSGFSLLLILTTDFPPIQLGFGFTLNGVGGLLGLNRSVQLDILRDGVRTGAVEDIVFPTDIIANAPRIISDLKTIFPPQQNVFLVGPMAKFGWGEPSLVTLSLGIIVEIPPGNIAILGVLQVALPTEDEALILIQVAFLGILDFDEQLLSFDASLYDSHVLFLTLEGDMAVRLKWGDNAAFILSVGGFHPAFHPPDGLHLPASMKRLTISILDYDWAKIKVDCYFAVTSNTVQFGAHLYLFFGVDAANITGQLGLDVLFQFSPFMFIAQMSGSLSIAVFGMDLLSISLNFQLSGPTPWEAKGTGSLSILFFSIDVSFDVTWGDKKDTALPPVDVMPIFLGEINKQSNWKALPPPSTNLLVTLRAVDPSLLVLHPFGSLTLSQRALPLKLKLDKVGNQKPDDVNVVDISSVSSNPGGGAPVTPLTLNDEDEQFAIAQYQDMSDSEKLSRPSYQLLKGGVIIGSSDSMQSSKMTRRTINYNTTIIDKDPQQPVFKGRLAALSGLFHPFLSGSAAARSPLSYKGKTQLRPFTDTIAVGQEGYVVSNTSDNKPVNTASSFSSEAMARDHMKSQVASNPSLADGVHVLPNSEVNAS